MEEQQAQETQSEQKSYERITGGIFSRKFVEVSIIVIMAVAILIHLIIVIVSIASFETMVWLQVWSMLAQLLTTFIWCTLLIIGVLILRQLEKLNSKKGDKK